jgi:hypothetical protein
MNRRLKGIAALVVAAALCGGCSAESKDYSLFRQHRPRSILVLPPLNETVEVNAPYSYLSTISQPLGECGYYVFPVAVVDAFMKDNGLPTPGEMHGVSLTKLREVFGADAVLYVTIEEYGQKYQVLSSTTVVEARARLVDTETSSTLWEGQAIGREASGGSGNLIADMIVAAIEQAVESTGDEAHDLSRRANFAMIFDEKAGFLRGPYSPSEGSDQRGR